MNYNKVNLAGNLTKDPDLKKTSPGSAICNIIIAVNESYKNNNGETIKSSSFFPVVIFGKSAENAAKYLTKGDPVFIEGKLKQEKWETQAGEKRQAIKVQCITIHFLGKIKQAGEPAAPEESHPHEAKDDNAPF